MKWTSVEKISVKNNKGFGYIWQKTFHCASQMVLISKHTEPPIVSFGSISLNENETMFGHLGMNNRETECIILILHKKEPVVCNLNPCMVLGVVIWYLRYGRLVATYRLTKALVSQFLYVSFWQKWFWRSEFVLRLQNTKVCQQFWIHFKMIHRGRCWS